jgi:hypothetical protein
MGNGEPQPDARGGDDIKGKRSFATKLLGGRQVLQDAAIAHRARGNDQHHDRRLISIWMPIAGLGVASHAFAGCTWLNVRPATDPIHRASLGPSLQDFMFITDDDDDIDSFALSM